MTSRTTTVSNNQMLSCRSYLGCLECVRLCITGSKRAFCQARSAVLAVGIELSNTMPVETSSIVLQAVFDSDLDGITPICKDGRSRELSIDQQAASLESIRRTCSVRNDKVVFAGHTSGGPFHIKVVVYAVSVLPALSREWTICAGSICRCGHWGRCGRRVTLQQRRRLSTAAPEIMIVSEVISTHKTSCCQ